MAAVQTKLFEGSDVCGLSPGHHVEAVQNGSFKAIGQLMVLSVLQEGPPPTFLAEWVYQYLCVPDITEIQLVDDDITNPDIKTLVKRIKEVNSTEELEAIFREDANMDVLMATGFTSQISLPKKDTVVRVVTLHHTVMRVKAELDQLREGLKLHGFLRYMEEYSSLMKMLFVPGEDYEVTSLFLMNSLKPEYSEAGSSKRQQETAVMANFNRYVEEMEDSQDSGSADNTVTRVYQFLTGKTKKLILPAEKNSFGITVKFIHCSSDHQICFPTVSTCSLWVQLPVAHMATFSNFKSNMDTALKQEVAFGRP